MSASKPDIEPTSPKLPILDPKPTWAGSKSRSAAYRYAAHGTQGSVRLDTLLSSASEPAVARLIGTHGPQEINLAKGRPQHIRKVELAMHALPEQET